jgi:Mg2+ and Co2+ transporter CorA
VSITALLSSAGGDDESVDLRSWGSRRLRKDELLWVDVVAPNEDESSVVASALRLGDEGAGLDVADGVEPNAVVHGDAIEVVVIALPQDPTEDPVPLRVLTGEGWIVTAHPRPIAFLDEHREQIQDQREVGRLTSVEFLASILDWHVETFFRAATRLEDEVDRLDDAALRARDGDLLQRLVAMRRRIARVRRVLTPHREVLAEMVEPTSCRTAIPGPSTP